MATKMRTKHDTAPNRNSPERYAGLLQEQSAGGGVALDEVDSELLGVVVAAVARSGDAIMLSHTRSGRAVRIAIYAGEERIVKYANSHDELVSLLETLRFVAETR